MTERAIQNAIWNDRGRQSAIMCPNYTPAEWWECDVWMVTKAGYSVEFEIKVSLADFKADRAKARNFYEDRDKPGADRWKETTRKKHDMLAARDRRAPSRFYYVTPSKLELPLELIPEWAGHITAEPGFYIDGAEKKQPSGAVRFDELKAAPKLHTQKVNEKIIDHCRSVFFYRYWQIRTQLREQKILTESPEGAESPHISGDLLDIPRVHDT